MGKYDSWSFKKALGMPSGCVKLTWLNGTEESIWRRFCQPRQSQRLGLGFQTSSSDRITLAEEGDCSFCLPEIVMLIKSPCCGQSCISSELISDQGSSYFLLSKQRLGLHFRSFADLVIWPRMQRNCCPRSCVSRSPGGDAITSKCPNKKKENKQTALPWRELVGAVLAD